MKYVSNIYPILNLNELSAQYRLCDIRGLRKNKEYQSNKQWLIDKLSRSLKHPITIIEKDQEPKLVIKNDENIISKIQGEHDYGRVNLHIDLTETIFNIDFTNPSEEVKKICTRFLQFDLNGELKKNPDLWQPYTGGPFFLKKSEEIKGITVFNGFIFRVVELPESGFGIIIDATRKFASVKPLSNYITKQDFLRLYRKSKELKSFIYKYSDWYEIQPTECDDFNVSEFKVNGTPLIELVRNVIPRPHSTELANLPNDGSVLTYYSSDGKTKGAPAGLLYEVLDFQDTSDSEVNKNAIIDPEFRFKEISQYKRNYFYKLKFGNAFLRIANRTLELPDKIMTFPNFELGNGFILNATQFSNPRDLAKQRINKLLDPSIGFYSNSPLPDQILVLPRSVYDTVGEKFMKMLIETVNKMYPADTYKPFKIVYEDKFKQGTDYVTVGRYIVDAVKKEYNKLGSSYGVVMIPRLEKKSKREHDKLSALVIRELKKLKLNCSIIHTDMVQLCFESRSDKNGKIYYDLKYDYNDKFKKRFNGYIKNVAITKVLLNCNKWPFVLSESLNADITIGIDVKNHTAGFLVIDKYGKHIRPELDESENKEKLSVEQTEAMIYKIIKDEYEIDSNTRIVNIVIHRDGRLYDTELEGLLFGLERLKRDMYLPPEANINVLEIHKTSFLSVRFYSLNRKDNEAKVIAENPPNGLHYYLKDEVFLCSTGKEFGHAGTSNPLNVKFIFGLMSKEKLLSDLFKFTTLAFTKPDDCLRLPITIKINDIRLSDAASEYEEDSFKHLEILLENLNIKTHE